MSDPVQDKLHQALNLVNEATSIAVNRSYPDESVHALCFVRDLLKRVKVTMPVPTKK